jgi:hypothetical protein
MESSQYDAAAAAAQLADAEERRTRLATRLRLPQGFHTILGVTIAIQTATAAFGIGAQTGAGLALVVAACVVFAAVVVLLAWRFRVLNGVWLDGLLARSLLGLTSEASWAYGVPFAAAVWAAVGRAEWLVVPASAVGGAAYAVAARRWWAAYQRDPVEHAQGDSRTVVATALVVIVAGVVVLVAFALGN